MMNVRWILNIAHLDYFEVTRDTNDFGSKPVTVGFPLGLDALTNIIVLAHFDAK